MLTSFAVLSGQKTPLLRYPGDSTRHFMMEILGHHPENVALSSELMRKDVNHLCPVVKQRALHLLTPGCLLAVSPKADLMVVLCK